VSDTADGSAARDAVTRLAWARHLLVAVDFDGTLAEIVERPSHAVAVPGAMAVLADLAAQARTNVAVISGRALDDLASRFGWPPDVELVGSHGLEFRSGMSVGLTPIASAHRQRIVAEVQRHAELIPGAMAEVKPYGAAFHYRMARPGQFDAALEDLRDLAERLEGVHSIDGHAVLELGVMPFTKGWAVDVLRRLTKATHVLYVGDDTTDEDAFRGLATADCGVKVGDGPTTATLRVRSPTEVVRLLEDLGHHRSARTPSAGVSL
jgi:trehalose 6-phosphate phosphatase